jgi:hypothetical protein
MTSPDEATRRVSDAIATALGEITTGWALVAATITDEGQQACWNLVSDGLPSWQHLGLLSYGVARVQSGIAEEEIED